MSPSMPKSPIEARTGFLVFAIVALIAAGVTAYVATSNERTGKASYSLGRGRSIIHVTRESEPVEFRKVTRFRWGVSLACVGMAVVSFTLYRKLDDCV